MGNFGSENFRKVIPIYHQQPQAPMLHHKSLILLFLVSLCLHASALQSTAGMVSSQIPQKHALKILNGQSPNAKVSKATPEPRRRLGKKDAPKCPKPDSDDDLWKTWHGATVKKPCSKDCKVHWKLTDYLKEINSCRSDGKDCAKMCKAAVLKP